MTLHVPSHASPSSFPVSRDGRVLSRRGRLAAAVVRTWVVAAGALVVLGAGSPWVRTGQVRRSAFGLAQTARAIGLVETGAQRAAVLALFFTPMAVAVMVLALSLRRHRLAGALGLLVGGVAVAAGAVGTRLPAAVEIGPRVTLVAGAVLVVGSGAELWLARRRPVTEGNA